MRWSLFLGFFALGVVAAVFAARGGSARSTDGTLSAAVGPGFSISLTQGGSAVTTLAPGTYTVNVSDMSTLHNFHLSGPGREPVDRRRHDQLADLDGHAVGGLLPLPVRCAPDDAARRLHGRLERRDDDGTDDELVRRRRPQARRRGRRRAPEQQQRRRPPRPRPTTTTAPTTTTTATGTPAPKLTARVLKLQATRSRILVTVKLSRAGQAVGGSPRPARQAGRPCRDSGPLDREAHAAPRPPAEPRPLRASSTRHRGRSHARHHARLRIT